MSAKFLEEYLYLRRLTLFTHAWKNTKMLVKVKAKGYRDSTIEK